ncbi:MAG: AmmeMemoRadiSam system protein B [Patescibacteria group bacterium]|nr:AmmeMemoRadiSam system protein B [Patescibacteria group bacterium]
MALVFSALLPHPPILIPTIGGNYLNQVKKTLSALEKVSLAFQSSSPEIVFLISPHGQINPDTILINGAKLFTGTLEQFGDDTTRLEFKGSPETCLKITDLADSKNISLQTIVESNLDHGAIVPLYFLSSNYKEFNLVPVSYSLGDVNSHLEFGRLIYGLAQASSKRIALIASGDLSHRLTPDAPAGYSPKGQEFDAELIKLLSENRLTEIPTMDPNFIDAAGECGYRSLLITLGALERLKITPEVLSYEGPFGVGYAVVNFGIKDNA